MAARGIDVNDLTHVINYNLPDEAEQYTHRSGRTGRADKNGISVAIINSREQHKIRQIEKVLGKGFAAAKIPTGEEVCSMQMLHLLKQVEETEIKEEIGEYLNSMSPKWNGINKDELIMKMLSIEFNRFLDYYRHAPDLNIREEPGRRTTGSSKDNKYPATEKDHCNIKLSLGYRANITPRHILRLFSASGVSGKNVGSIDIQNEFSLISVPSNMAEFICDNLSGTEYRGRILKVQKEGSNGDHYSRGNSNRSGNRNKSNTSSSNRSNNSNNNDSDSSSNSDSNSNRNRDDYKRDFPRKDNSYFDEKRGDYPGSRSRGDKRTSRDGFKRKSSGKASTSKKRKR